MKKKLTCLLAVLMVISMLAGCGSKAPAANDTPAANGDAPAESGKFLRVSMAGAPADLNPLTCSTTEGSELLGCMYEGLVRQNADGQILPGSGLAEKWDISEDGLVYTFTLRDAIWSDGSAITAEQFAYAWEKVLNPATASEYAYMLYVIENATEYNTGDLTDFSQVGVKALDDKTLQVTLTAPTDYFLEMLVISQYGALPLNFAEDNGVDMFLDPAHMIFNGPFVCTEWTPDVSMTFEKNDKYWDADSVKLAGVKYNFVMDTNTIINLYETDELDLMLVQPEFLDTYRGAAGFVSVTEPVTEYLKFNFNDRFFSNENIRRAFSLSLDRVTYINNFMRTGSTPAYAYVPDSIHGPNGTGFRSAYGDLYYDIGTNPDALQEAKDLLAKGLEEVGATFEEFNTGLSLVIGEGDLNLKTAQVVQEYWKNNLGIDLEVRSMRYAMRKEAYNTNDFTIGKEGWGADYNDAQSFLELFESNSPYNDCGYANPEFDRIMNEAKNSTGDARLKLLQDAEKILVQDDAAIAPTFFQTRSWVSKDNVGGIVRQGIGLRCDYKWAYVN